MIITIIFMMASLSLIIFLPMYIKRKNRFYSLRPQEAKTKNLKKQKKNIKTIWGIDKIKNGIITINGIHSEIYELGSIEYNLLNEAEQNVIDEKLTGIAKTFKNQIQFFSTVDKIDTSEKIKVIQNNIANKHNEKLTYYGERIIKYLEEIMEDENLYVRKNYIIATSPEQFEVAKMELNDFFIHLRENLYGIKVKCRKLEDIEIIELINKEFNKNNKESIKNIIMGGGLNFYADKKAEK